MLIEKNLLDRPDSTDSLSVFKALRAHMAVALGASISGIVLALISIVIAVQKGNKVQQPVAVPTPFAIPFRYLVDDSYILPPTNQSSLGTCWAFSAVYMLESAYRAQGVRSGLLSLRDYVPFSKQAFLRFLRDHCTTGPAPKPKACGYGGIKDNDPSDGQIEALWYFYNAWPEIGTSIFPESICPYETNKSLWFYCQPYEAAIAARKNPLNWTIKSITTVYTIDAIKDLLVRTGRSLGFGTPLPNLIYYIPCEGSPFNDTAVCVNRTYPCPDYSGGPTGFCYKAAFDARDQTGVFLGSVDPKFMGELGGHAMNVVGYNDDWVYRNRFQAAPAASHKGGFILHNSWREGGHSAEYFFGTQSEENEAVICPNHVAPVNWIPATFECVSEAVSASGRIDPDFNCTADKPIERIRGKNRTRSPDLLIRCVRVNGEEVCDQDKFYVLERVGNDVNAKFTASGLTDVTFVTIVNSTRTVGRETVKNLPFWALSQLFRPHPKTFVPNHPNDCGYWMMPYETLENMQRINWDLLDNFRVVDLEIEFTETSYALHPNASQYDLTYLRNSTLPRNKTKFTGPVPFDLIY